MDCCNYGDYRTRAPTPAPSYASYGRYMAPTPAYGPLYGDLYASPAPDYSQHLHPQHHRPYDAYHLHSVRRPEYMHHAQPLLPEYLYGGKEARSRRGLRDRERDRERPRPQYHPHRWTGGLQYGDEMHSYMPEMETNHTNWNYYQGNGWTNEQDQWTNNMSRSMTYGQPQMQHQYRQDPLRGLAAMQANNPLPVEDKMTTMSAMPSMMQAMPSSCAYGECSCGSCIPKSQPNHLPNDSVLQSHPPIQRRTEETKLYSSDRLKKSKSPKSAIKEDRSMTPALNDASNCKVESTPLPAFQQAFGSTEIGRFSGAFIQTENDNEIQSITEEMVRDAIWSQLGDGISDEWKDTSVQLDACFEPLPSGPTPAWNHNPTPTPAHHIY